MPEGLARRREADPVRLAVEQLDDRGGLQRAGRDVGGDAVHRGAHGRELPRPMAKSTVRTVVVRSRAGMLGVVDCTGSLQDGVLVLGRQCLNSASHFWKKPCASFMTSLS